MISTNAPRTINEKNTEIVPVSFYTNCTDLDFIYRQDTVLSRAILIGNVPSYLSNNFILSPRIQYFDDKVFPDSIPCIYIYNKRDNGYFFEDSIYVPYKQLENNLIQDESDRYYSYLPNALFFEEGNKVFISTGCTIYELIGKHSLKKLVDTESKIKNFVKNNNEFVLVVKDSTDNYYVEKYNAETGLEINRRELLPGNKYYTSCFDGNSLYVIYMNEEKFYLHEEEI